MTLVVRDPKGEEILLENEAQTAELQTLNTNVSKESKQDTQITQAQSTNTKLDTLNATDFATEAKQDDIITAINGIAGGGAPTAVESTVSQSATSVTIIASNTDRREVIITNKAQGNQTLYISYSGTATANSTIELRKGDTLVEDVYTGVISGIWSSGGSGIAAITEVTNP